MSTPDSYPPAPQNSHRQRPTPPPPPAPSTPQNNTQQHDRQTAKNNQETKSGAFYETLKTAGAKVRSVSAEQASRLKEANTNHRSNIENGENLESEGFFKALFDLNFYHFITIKYAKLIYLIVIGVIALIVVGGALLCFATLAAAGEPGYGFFIGLLWLIGGAILGFLNIIGARLVLELFVAIIRVAENTTYLRKQLHETTEVIREKK